MGRPLPTPAFAHLFRLTAVLIGASALVLGSAHPAFAHDQLLSSEPAASAELSASPSEVSLEFSDKVLTVGAVILLVDESNTEWISAEPTLDGPTVTAPTDAALPDGSYEVRWRVVSSDGHPISGIIPFTVGDAAPVGEASAAGDAPVSAQDPEEAAETGAIAAARGAEHAEHEAAGGSDLWRTVAIGAAGASSALLLFIAWSFRRRNPKQAPNSSK